jgi:hypothetical protein
VEAISENPVVALFVDCCHLYSSAPDCPDGKAVLVIKPGLNPDAPHWSLPTVPPLVGLVPLMVTE